MDHKANLETRKFHRVFLLPHADKSDNRIKTRDHIEVKFYADGAFIGIFSTKILHLQYIPHPRDGSSHLAPSAKQTPLLAPLITKIPKTWANSKSENQFSPLHLIHTREKLETHNFTKSSILFHSTAPSLNPHLADILPQFTISQVPTPQLVHPRLLSPHLPSTNPTILHPSTHKSLYKSHPLTQEPQLTCQFIIVKFNTTTMTTTPPTNPNTPISYLLTKFQEQHHPLPRLSSISYAHKMICPSTPISSFSHITTPIFTINLPIRGGSTPSKSLPQQPQSSSTRPLKKRIITRQHFSLRIATLNCNGAPKQSSCNNHKLLWEFISTQKIDVLFLIDHRSSTRSLEFLRQQGEQHLNQDIRLITSEITLLNTLPHHQGPDTSYHATVGGCAILTFGALAHITFPSAFSDPSGANSFIGAKIQYCSSVPPLFLNALYLFPPSQGPSTLASRIQNYLTSIKSSINPCEWQRNTIASLLQNQHDLHPNCAQITGGDFNHSNWSSSSHPITNLFLSQLKFTNDVFTATTLDNTIQTPITFPSASTWIDHFLTKGRVTTDNYETHPHSLLTTYTDHIPYTNDFTIFIPTQHYNIPQNMNIQAQSFMKSPHIKKMTNSP